VLAGYRAALESADLSDSARRGYGSRIAGFLDWLATGPDLGVDGDPLTQPAARDYAVRDYRSWLKTVRRATPWTVNAHLTALDHSARTWPPRAGSPCPPPPLGASARRRAGFLAAS
jgi:hypothetical protein